MLCGVCFETSTVQMPASASDAHTSELGWGACARAHATPVHAGTSGSGAHSLGCQTCPTGGLTLPTESRLWVRGHRLLWMFQAPRWACVSMSLALFSHRVPLAKTTQHRVAWTRFLGKMFLEASLLLAIIAEGGQGGKGLEGVQPSGDPEETSFLVSSPPHCGEPWDPSPAPNSKQAGQCRETRSVQGHE